MTLSPERIVTSACSRKILEAAILARIELDFVPRRKIKGAEEDRLSASNAKTITGLIEQHASPDFTIRHGEWYPVIYDRWVKSAIDSVKFTFTDRSKFSAPRTAARPECCP